MRFGQNYWMLAALSYLSDHPLTGVHVCRFAVRGCAILIFAPNLAG